MVPSHTIAQSTTPWWRRGNVLSAEGHQFSHIVYMAYIQSTQTINDLIIKSCWKPPMGDVSHIAMDIVATISA